MAINYQYANLSTLFGSLFQFNYQRNVTSVLPRGSGERFGQTNDQNRDGGLPDHPFGGAAD